MLKRNNFHSLYGKIRCIYVNASLYKKIITLVLIILCLNLFANIIALSVITRSNNKLLYEAISNTLITGTKTISEKLRNIQEMTDIIIADSRIQTNLAIVADSKDNAKRSNAFRTLSFLVPEYYTNYKSNKIKYMNLYNNDYVSYSNIALSNKIPDSIHNQLLLKADEKSGRPVWSDSYCNEYGLFLVRNIRKAEQLALNTIGTVLVNIDLDSVVNTSVNTTMFSEPAQFIITSNNKEIYHSKTLDSDSVSQACQKTDSKYGIIRLNQRQYFYVHETIPYFTWDFICLVSYQNIYTAQTLTILSAICINFAAIFLIFLIAKFMINSITIHFSKLVDKMKTFGKSKTFIKDTSYDYSNRKDEIGELHRNFDLMAIRHQNLVEKFFLQEILTRDSKIKALENQINPHFLYNTLESINWRAKALGEKDISIMIESLGSLLRTTLSKKDNNLTSTLEQEINIVKNYMDIIRIRFDDRICFTTSIDIRLNSILLPRLSLQPLVENAVNYAMEKITETCLIEIKGYIDGSFAIIQIKNNGSQFEDDLLQKLENNLIKPHGNGIGILNIQKRIQLSYGEEYGLQFFNPDDDHAIAQIQIPYKESTYD